MAGLMLGSAPLRNEIFAGNRAVGRIAFTVAAGLGGSRRGRVHEAGSLRVRFPNGNSQALEAVIVNTGGGMTGGDRFDIDIKVGAGARLSVTTAAAEKIYRSLGPDTDICVKLDVGAGGALAWLPQETIVFDQARLRRGIDIELARDANLLLAEAAVFGRSAMGEAVVQGHFFDRWRLRVEGALIFAETLRLDGDIAQRLAQRAIAAGGVAVASVIKYPGSDADAVAVRAMQDRFTGEVGVSAWNGLVAARLVAPDGAALRRDLVAVLNALDAAPLPRLWLN
ncbi:MAG TPA: urease accessory protein UreD [Xanthobacteraceae bacterium]|jgi:urease accessory protein|nr:urease accessory protein UreD [Xanthobacteraceae bacterium]